MSAFLAPIHFWLYGKIRRVVEREGMIYEQAAEVCGATAEEIRATVWQSYGEPLPDVALDELIDQGNIHGWLQRQINIAETREAAFINELTNTCGQTAEDLVTAVFAEHGKQCGEHARGKGVYNLEGADGIYKALNDYFLNGMPCDQVQMVTENTPDRLVWEASRCLKEGNWLKAGIAPAAMRRLYQTWLGAFVTAANPGFRHQLTAGPCCGGAAARNEITRK